MDPSFDDAGNICFKFGNKPAIDKSSNWWNTNVKHFKPEHNCRLGTKSEYIAFLGVLIKTFVSEGWPVDVAWNAVCNDSKELGHYLNSVDAKRNIELTGSRKIAGFYDLGNTCKILACDEDEKSFLFAGGRYTCDSNRFPLADLCYDEFSRYAICGSVGWIVHS